ncbi:MAG: phosphatidyl-myo-inositol alpha-mannosyltransferase [Chloroflexota bacterium]|jgi:glycosyltransferase involved in cell wall biosynthesis|nr:phosphatidyl-myo-inositol alpha-mannosyltransferase [Chloroflexota bacterium]
MKIALVHTTLPNPVRRKDNGVTHWVHRLGNHLVEAGHEVTAFSADPRPPDALYAVRPLPAPAWATRGVLGRALALPWFLNRIPSRDFDVVSTHGDDPFFFARNRVRSFYGSALGEMLSAVRWRRRASTALNYPLELLSAALAPAAVAMSNTTQRHFPFVKRRVEFAVDGRVYHPGAKAKEPTILFVGTVKGRKRGDFLLDVFQTVVRPAVPNARLLMVCDEPVSGEGVVDMGRVATEADMGELYRSAWVYCLPSTYEGLSLTYLESLASGTAAIFTPARAAREALGEPPAGLLPSDEDYGQAIVRVLSDEVFRQDLEQRGVRRAEFYTWQRTVAGLVAIFEEVRDRSRKARPALARHKTDSVD